MSTLDKVNLQTNKDYMHEITGVNLEISKVGESFVKVILNDDFSTNDEGGFEAKIEYLIKGLTSKKYEKFMV